YVPRIEVIDKPTELLGRLAFGGDDLRKVAFVDAALPSGFTGVEGNDGAGRVDFLLNDPEHLVLQVDAPANGFLLLADQNAPGWQVTVNGEPRSIVQANYVSRLIEVPAGRSRVEFRYRPWTVGAGALMSGLTLLGMAVIMLAIRRRSPRLPAA